MHDITRFSLADMAACSARLRRFGGDAGSMREAAEGIVRFLYDELGCQEKTRRAMALVRLFKTHCYNQLPPARQEFARKALGREPDNGAMKCLTLLATQGVRSEWQTVDGSRGHQAVPLAGAEAVGRIPMIANLVKQFGLEINQVLQPDPALLTDLSERTFNVFHVAEALGSPYIPAQQEFVVPEGIRSVLGFGGMLPAGDLYVVIMFSMTPISAETASLFQSLSLSAKASLLPFERRVF